jgi:5-methyltetrahydrofolate--homocysteine methyltransferase
VFNLSLLADIEQAVMGGNMAKAKEYTEQAIAAGLDVAEILNDGLIAGMNIMGGRFKLNQVFIPEVLIAARAMHAGMDVLKPLIAKAGIKEVGTIVMGTVKDDLHDIGKDLVIMMWEGAGFKVIDLGIDVPAAKFIQAIEEHNPDIVGLSALLTTTMEQMRLTVEQLQAYRSRVKIMVGGAPVTQKFADAIGADSYAPDGGTAIEKAKQLIIG